MFSVRSIYRRRDRVKRRSGQTVLSKTFGNGGPGERAYTFTEDTSADAAAPCWARTPSKIVKLDVIGCRGHVCDLGAFE